MTEQKFAAKKIDLSDWKHQFVSMPAYILILLLGFAFTAKDQVADVFGFVTIAQAEELETKVDQLTLTVNMDVATRMVTRYEEQLQKQITNGIDGEDRRRTERRLKLANDYRACILDGHENCTEIQKQLWQ